MRSFNFNNSALTTGLSESSGISDFDSSEIPGISGTGVSPGPSSNETTSTSFSILFLAPSNISFNLYIDIT